MMILLLVRRRSLLYLFDVSMKFPVLASGNKAKYCPRALVISSAQLYFIFLASSSQSALLSRAVVFAGRTPVGLLGQFLAPFAL